MINFSLWKSKQWQSFQEDLGRKTWRIGNSLVIQHKLPFGKCWLEIINSASGLAFSDLYRKKLEKIRKESGAVFAEFGPNGLPETTLVLDLSLSEEDLLKQMKSKGRYNIRLAGKRGVKIVKDVQSVQGIKEFCRLLKETTQRDGFKGHDEKYYKKMLNQLGENCSLILAEYNKEIIAGAIFTYIGDNAVYYYGASGSKYRNVMAPYLIQWEAICEAKKRKKKYFDFLGIDPENKMRGKWKGITDFKMKFGGEIKNYNILPPIVFKPFWRFLYKSARILR